MKVKVVGPFSGQVGGVASYISRLVKNQHIDEIYDPYSGICYVKNSSGTYEVKSKYAYFFRYIYLLFFCKYSKNELVFLNFSTTNSLIIEILMGCSLNRRYIFHNGKPTNAKFSFLNRLIFSIKKLKVISLTERQMVEFYEKYECVTCRDIVYIPPFIDFKKSDKDKDILIAGYAKSLYNIDCFLDLVSQRVESFKNFKISVVLYGEPDVKIYQKIKTYCDTLHFVDLYEEMPERDFLKLLSRHRIYIRPTTIDSFGFSVQDALSLGCVSYCSSIIPRPAGAKTFDLPLNNKVLSELLLLASHDNESKRREAPKSLMSFNTNSYL